MRRGMQGHVVGPHGPTRAPAWHRCDMRAMFIFIYIFYIVYSKYKRPDYRNLLPLKTVSPYIPNGFYSFSPCGTMFPSLSLIAGRVTLRGASDGDRVERRASMRWTRDPPDL